MKGDNGAPLDAAAFGASMLRVEEELGRVIDDVLAAAVGDGGGDATAMPVSYTHLTLPTILLV